MKRPAPAEMELVDGAYLDVANPSAVQISFRSIACGLGNTCRFSGQTEQFYSVAEHSMLVSSLVHTLGGDLQLQVAALFHDGHEAFLSDLVQPLKSELVRRGDTAYNEIALGIDHAIAAVIGIPVEAFYDPIVKTADLWALRLEARSMCESGGLGWDLPPHVPLKTPRGYRGPQYLSPASAKQQWTFQAGVLLRALEQIGGASNVDA